jgi:hypothetical protein
MENASIPLRRGSDRWQSRRQAKGVAGVQSDCGAVPVNDHPIAVVFDLMNPIGAGRCSAGRFLFAFCSTHACFGPANLTPSLSSPAEQGSGEPIKCNGESSWASPRTVWALRGRLALGSQGGWNCPAIDRTSKRLTMLRVRSITNRSWTLPLSRQLIR